MGFTKGKIMLIPRSSVWYCAVLFFTISVAVDNDLYAQFISTANQFIVGTVDAPSTGLVTVLLPPGRIAANKQLSFDQHSYFTCMIGDQLYTNNDRNGVPANGHLLTGGITIKVADT